MPKAPLLVTGAAGFIGARFVEARRRAGCELWSVDRPAHFRDRGEHRGVDFGYILDREGLPALLERERPALSAIVHLGAITDTTELDVAKLTRWNLEYTQALWRYATRQGIPFYYASSAATYGDGALGYDDDEALIPRLKPLNPYGDSKQQFDLWALEQEAAGEAPPAWAGFKFFNVYGFGERHKQKMASVVLHAFDQIRAGGPVRLFKSYREDIAHGWQRRDFIWVGDVVRVLGFALDSGLPRGIYNLGTGQARSYLDLARAVFRAQHLPEDIAFIEMPSALVPRYQYFTEARMERLRAAGYSSAFTSLEQGVSHYVSELAARA